MTKRELIDIIKDVSDDSLVDVRDAFCTNSSMEFQIKVDRDKDGKDTVVIEVETFDPF